VVRTDPALGQGRAADPDHAALAEFAASFPVQLAQVTKRVFKLVRHTVGQSMLVSCFEADPTMLSIYSAGLVPGLNGILWRGRSGVFHAYRLLHSQWSSAV
jgi:hypothetical protein